MNEILIGFLSKIFGGVNTGVTVVFYLVIFFVFFVAVELLLTAFKAGRKSRIHFRVILVATFVTLLGGELVLRWSGKVATYPESRFGRYVSPYACDGRKYWTWNNDHFLKTSEYSFFRKTNSEGLADREFDAAKTKGEYRIIALGDSFTEGDGARTADSWPKSLERILNRRESGGMVSVINAGVCGSDPAYGYVLLRDRLFKYRPDLVVVVINTSDIMDFHYRGGMERFHPDGTVTYAEPPKWEWLYALSHLSRLVIHAWGYDSTLTRWEDRKRLAQLALDKIKDTLRSFSALAKRERFLLLAVFCPFQMEIDDVDFVFDGFAEELEAQDGITALDLRRYFREVEGIDGGSSRLYYWPEDKHPNARGYAAIARGVKWKMRKMGILPQQGTAE